MTQQQVPVPGTKITADYIDYTVIQAIRMSDKGKKFQGRPWSDNIAMTVKRPKGKKYYSIILYPSGSYSRPISY